MKRSNGEGSIYKRSDGRWCATFYDDTPNPKRHSVYGKTQAEVKRKLKVKRENLVLGNDTPVALYTIESWILYYLETYKKNEVKKTTFDTYMDQYRRHIRGSGIGKSKLEQLTSDRLQKYYNAKITDGYNPKTIRHIYILINSAFKKAVQLKIITENVNNAVTLPRIKEYKAKMLSTEEVKIILNEAKRDELYPLIILTIYTGLRKGEVMALRWENINFEEKELYVEGNLCRVVKDTKDDGKRIYDYEILSPKTEKSKRTLPLVDVALEALKLQKQYQNEQKKKYKTIYSDKGFVFTRFDGNFLDQRGFMDKYHEFLKHYKITDVRFHDLRHTFASLLLEAGESPKIMQELLGHSTITTTMDIYAHVTKQGKVKAMKKLDEIFCER